MPPRKASGLGANGAHEARRGDLLGRRIGAEATHLRLLAQGRSVYEGRRYLGFILQRDLERDELVFEAFDAKEKSLGLFHTLAKAAIAISLGAAP